VSSAKCALNAVLDGADVDGRWDVSTICAYDGMVDSKLRLQLLDLLKSDDAWDASTGADPKLWQAGALVDVVGKKKGTKKANSKGLRPKAMRALCDEEEAPCALIELQTRVARLLRSLNGDLVDVCRLPTAAVFGDESVLPLAANAPVFADEGEYAWHIDADPLQLPLSPWTDAYGRYPNRTPGKPRFVSALVYLSDPWDFEAWGAPTRARDPPSGEVIDVPPTPGRVVFMDQDVTHTVVAPNEAAGPRPRYSLVLKLVLFPHAEKGAVHLVAPGGAQKIVGSAGKRPSASAPPKINGAKRPSKPAKPAAAKN